MSEPGVRVANRYEVLSRLGAGGMGVVFLARDTKLDREVALKALSIAELGDTRGRARLLREARAAAKLEHPGIVQVHDVVETDDGAVYIVMERVRGRSLRALLALGPLEPAEAAQVVTGAADALTAAHQAGVVHRDVKPDNVMVRDDGRVVVLDFGLVKDIAKEGAVDRSPTLEELTRSGAVIGTPAYVAPEQARGKGVEPRSDQFALAVVAYELLTGQLPWQAETPTQMLAMILMDDPPPATSVRSELPAAVDAVLSRALSKKPEDRFDDVRAFAEALAEVVGAERSAPAPAKAPRRLLRWLAVAAGIAAVIATISVWRFADETAVAEHGAPAAPLSDPNATLACPILEVRGIDPPVGWLGAAAADLICRRADAMLGARPDSTRTPAELLDLPALAGESFPDEPFERDARARTLERASSSDAWIDGTVSYDDGAFGLEVALVTSSGVVARRTVEAGSLAQAVWQLLEAWAEEGIVPIAESIHPEVARWEPFGSPRELVDQLDFRTAILAGVEIEPRCRRLLDWALEHMPNQATDLAGVCRPYIGSVDAPPPRLDESSIEALQASVYFAASSLGAEEAERAARALAEARTRERSEVAKAALFTAEGLLWAQRGENERAIPLLQAGIGLNPRSIVRVFLTRALYPGDGFGASARCETAWDPSASEPWRARSFFVEDDDQRLAILRRAAILAPGMPLVQAQYGEQLVAAGRREEARALASRLVVGEPHDRLAGAYIEALVLADEARFDRALTKAMSALEGLERFGAFINGDILMWNLTALLAEVLGRSEEIADRLLERFVLAEPHRLATHEMYYEMSVIPRCIAASRPIARRCLETVELLARGRPGGSLPPMAALIAGGYRYVEGDLAGAAEHWRPLVGEKWSPVPTRAFEAAGMPELAERLDAKRMERPMFTGVTPAHARAAKRALARGDDARARELATLVVNRWSVADARVPAVDEMRALLESVPAAE